MGLSSCSKDDLPQLEFVVGGAEPRRFTPVVAFAEYTELPTTGDELRITLASYKASCDDFIPPGPSDVMVSLTTVLPKGQTLNPGVIPWSGHEAHGGTPTEPLVAYVLPQIRVGHEVYALGPGGQMELKGIKLDRHGEVQGVLHFEHSGGEGQPSSALLGAFTAKICRTSVNTNAERH